MKSIQPGFTVVYNLNCQFGDNPVVRRGASAPILIGNNIDIRIANCVTIELIDAIDHNLPHIANIGRVMTDQSRGFDAVERIIFSWIEC